MVFLYTTIRKKNMKDRYDLTPEIICEYPVSTNRKKLWVCEIDLLNTLDDLCTKLGISYFMLWGSAIGAVRHKGFIPWDDDIDIGMLRDDFEILRKNISGVFPSYVDIQYGVSEHGVDSLLRIRDGRTTGIIFHETEMPGNKGIFIEIYPFDYISNLALNKIQVRLNFVLQKCMKAKFHQTKKGFLVRSLYRIMNTLFTTEKMWKMTESIGQWQNKKRGKYIDTPTIPSSYTIKGEHLVLLEDCIETIVVPFEYTEARIPKGYDRVLKKQYPNYMDLPPVEKRGTHHRNIVFYDPNRSYTEYEGDGRLEKYFAGDNRFELL